MFSRPTSSKRLSKISGKREITENQPVLPPRRPNPSTLDNTGGEYQSPVPAKLGTPKNAVSDAPPPLPSKPEALTDARDETPPVQLRTGLTATASMRLQPQQRLQLARHVTISSSPGGDLKKGVLDALRCPICSQYMVPPIFMCASGHSICDTCKAKCQDVCPSCGERIETTRNLALERLAESSSSLYPCGHWERGCRQQLPSKQLRRHEAGCIFRPLLCPLACGWHGRRDHLLSHAKCAHPNRYSAVVDTSVPHIQWDLPLKASFHDYRHAVFAFGESFAYVKHFSEEKRKMYLAVQLLGDPGNTSSFRYKFEMTKEKGGCYESMSRTRSVHSCDEDLDTVLQSNACITIDFETLVYFGNGPRTFMIFKVQQKDASISKLPVI
ncbi:E3 ubiquitin-protein ligase Siah1-like [Schistocerca cancellata]|uniref:E3 ubiquitin-protein ligase Siah1-like n=1 Tax=Schistocerca cancellata TaxID=274614 RepID=UPI0021199296|nr:E3 ubiquitin-protein ligase Siah1-like [Schistocerca cancellata]